MLPRIDVMRITGFIPLNSLSGEHRVPIFTIYIRGGGGGGGWWVHPHFLVKFDFEIAIDQQTRACEQTVEGVLDSGSRPVPGGHPLDPLQYSVQIMPNHLNIL